MSTQGPHDDTILLTDGRTRASFSRSTGALTGLEDATGWDVVARAVLGEAFRLLVPLEGRRHNVVEGVRQLRPYVEVDDREFGSYALSYHRSEDRHHLPLHRYTAPDRQMMTAVTGFDDRNMVNQSLLHRYVVSLEPYNFTGRLTDFPATVAYNQRMHDLRVAARRWVWDGHFSDTVGATVTDETGAAFHPFTVFTADDGSRAVCVANYDTHPVMCQVRVDGHDGGYRVRTVDDEDWSDLDGPLALAGRSAAVVIASPVGPAGFEPTTSTV